MNPFEQFLEDAKRVSLTPEEKQSIQSAVSQHMAPHSFLSFFSMSILKPVSWGIALLAVAFIGVSSYAYASAQVTKGNALYSLKLSYERMKVRGADTRLEKVRVYSALALRRLAEAKVLARESGMTQVPGAVSLLRIPVANAETIALNGVEAEIADGETVTFLISTLGEVTVLNETAIEEAEEITDPAQLQDALEVIDETQTEALEGLEEVASEVGVEAPEELVDAVAVALDETAQDAVAVDAALEDVAEALEAGEAEVVVEVETSADAAAEDEASEGEEEADDDADETPDENTVKLEAMQQTMTTFKADLLASGVSEEEAAKLFARVDAKLLKAQEALEDGNVHKMNGLLKATNALTNNAKHFAKKAQRDDADDDEDGDEEGEEGDGDAAEDADQPADETDEGDGSEPGADIGEGETDGTSEDPSDTDEAAVEPDATEGETSAAADGGDADAAVTAETSAGEQGRASASGKANVNIGKAKGKKN